MNPSLHPLPWPPSTSAHRLQGGAGGRHKVRVRQAGSCGQGGSGAWCGVQRWLGLCGVAWHWVQRLFRLPSQAAHVPLPSPQLRVFHGHPQGVVSVKFTTLVRACLNGNGMHTRRGSQRVLQNGSCLRLGLHRRNPPSPLLVQEAADECVRIMNGRFFGGRQLEAAKWDGFTNFNVKVRRAVLGCAGLVVGREAGWIIGFGGA